MTLLSQLLCAAVFTASFGNAAPTKGKTFSVSQHPVNLGYRTHGAHQMMKTYAKFGVAPPVHIAAAVQASNGTVVAVNADSYDTEYLCTALVGTIPLQMDFDTGSSDFWAFSTQQPPSQSAGHHLYQPSSSAKQILGNTWNITYGDGSRALGVVYTDTVTIGGVTYASQAVEAAISVSAGFVSNRADGLIGLAFNSLNQVRPAPQKTFLSNISPSLASPVMVANLKYHGSGTYDFGYINQSRYTGQISYTPVNQATGYWSITVSGFGSLGLTIPTVFSAIVDTGTSIVYLPTAVLVAYYAKIIGAQNSLIYGGWVVPCKATLPNFTLQIGSFSAVIPGKYIIYGPVESTGTTCYGGLQDSIGLPFSILGDIFLKSLMVVFENSASPRIGLAVPSSLP